MEHSLWLGKPQVQLYRPINYIPAWSEITGNPFIITTPSNGQLLKYDGTNWLNFTPNYLTSFVELDPAFTANFDFAGAVANDLLQFNGIKWVNFTPNFALTSHTHSDVTTSISGFMSGADKTKLDVLQNADGSETKVTAGTNVTVTGAGTAASPYVVNATGGGAGILTLLQVLVNGNDAGANKIVNLANPVNDQDAATKAYVDALLDRIDKLEELEALLTKVIDADHNLYPVVKIGTQVWLRENLKTTKYNDGTPILYVPDNTEWGGLTTPGYCWYNNDADTYKATYGAIIQLVHS